jgi:hypothetical protein
MSDCPFNVQPYNQSGQLPPPNIISLNYTNQDFWSMKQRLIDFIKEKFGKDFNDFVESSLAIMLIENWAFIADTLSFKMDQIANEVFIDTVTEVENAFRLSKLVGFRPQPPISARSLWTARLNNPILTDISIPCPFDIDVTAGTETITIELFPADSQNNPIFDQDIVMPAGSIVNSSIVGLEGFTYTDENQGTGLVGQTITLSNFPVLYDSIRVDVDGVRWTQVDEFTDSQPRREYRVEFNSLYQGFVIFGNNRAGLIPAQGSKIEIKYRRGGGSRGNIVTQSIQTETVVPLPGFEYSVPVSLSNYTKGEFGYDGDQIEDIRRKLPAWLKLQDRCVTGDDYKTMADQFSSAYQGQTGKSTAVLRNYGCAANIIDIYVLARGKGANDLQVGSSQFKAELEEMIDGKKMFSDFVCIKDGTILLTDISIDVVMDKFYRKFEDQYRARVTQIVNSFFALNNWDYKQSLKQEDINKELSSIREVKRFEMTFLTNDPENGGGLVTARFNEIIRPDTVSITFVYE